MNFAHYPHSQALREPGRIAVVEDELTLTYGEFDRLSGAIAHRLRDAGLRKGHVCALVVHDDGLHLAAMFAILRLGATVLPLDWRLGVAELRRIVEQIVPQRIVATQRPLVGGAIHVELVDPGPGAGFLGAIEPLPGDCPAFLGLSSGTTGAPKAMVISHAQQIARMLPYLVDYTARGTDRYMSTIPLAYSWGRNLALTHLCIGATIILYPSMFIAEDLVAAVRERQATTSSVAPNMSRVLLGLAPPGEFLMPGLRAYFSSSEPLTVQERAGLRGRVAANLIDAYGTTESGVVAVASGREMDMAPMSAGRAAVGIEVETVDDDDKPLAPGEIGRLRLRGATVAGPYLRGATAQSATATLAWVYPGDMARIDAQGLIYLQGRRADIIKRMGIAIYATEIEGILRDHPAVAEAAAIGVPSPGRGEEVVVFVVLRTEVDLASIARHCRDNLSPFKLPRDIRRLDALPRNAGGKVMRATLLAMV
jgi:acyl-coenzyme A synthetase/AMP-(fatty) acid ligase